MAMNDARWNVAHAVICGLGWNVQREIQVQIHQVQLLLDHEGQVQMDGEVESTHWKVMVHHILHNRGIEQIVQVQVDG